MHLDLASLRDRLDLMENQRRTAIHHSLLRPVTVWTVLARWLGWAL